MKLSPLAGRPAPPSILIDVSRLIAAYHAEVPDFAVPTQRVMFGTSGHRGSSLGRTFNEWHVLAITQAICLHRTQQHIDGPLFLGIDTHALSGPACATALEVLAANGIMVMIAENDEYTPTPVISHAILAHNRGRKAGLADGIVLTSSHNPPGTGGLKYNAPNGGPADSQVTAWVEAKANALLEARLAGVKRIHHERAMRIATTLRHDYINPYINDLGNVVDLEVVRGAKLRLGVDPLGGAGVHYWARLADRHGLDLTVVNNTVDPTFSFMSADWDGQIRMDPSSPYAMARLIGMKDRFDLSFASDPDHDRHGIVTRSAGLLTPNQFLAVAISQLFPNRPKWDPKAAVGKTSVTSAMIDRVTAKLGRQLYEVPVGFKWFVDGLFDGSLGIGGEESAGTSFLRRDGAVWTTDKDGFIPCLLAAEIMGKTGQDPGELYRGLTREFGEPHYQRTEAPATPEEQAVLKRLSPDQIKSTVMAGEEIQTILTKAPGNGEPLGGVKVITASGWYAVRPSGTEATYRIYAESFQGTDHLRQILAAAHATVAAVLTAPLAAKPPQPLDAPSGHQNSVQEAEDVWRNEGDPN